MKIIFASNSLFGKIALEKMINLGAKPSLLLTSPDKKRGRGLKFEKLFIEDFAQKQKIETKKVEDKNDFHEIIKKNQPYLVIVAGMSIIIPKETLALSKFINIHPSLLPKYRGPSPIQSAILSGEKKNGVTVIEMEERIDAGPILLQAETELPSNVNYLEAEEIFAKNGAEMIVKNINSIIEEKIRKIEQNESDATYSKKFKKEDGRINWEESAQVIERKIRALNPWPGTYSKMGSKIFKIIEATVQEQTANGPFGEPGKMYLGTNHTIAIQTGKDFLLVKKLQIEGKNSTNSKDFLQGNMHSIGVILS